MTEDEARGWIRERYGVSRETRLAAFGELLLAENARQNLIARSTEDALWSRHFVDSAQLVGLAPQDGAWLDIGSGGGLPGMIVALLRDAPVCLVEPRARRAEFLRAAADALDLGGVSVIARKVEQVSAPPFAVISARAVAALGAVLRSAAHLADASTLWLLPKGRGAQSEVDEARRTWQGAFHVEQSVTDPASGIVVVRRVRGR